MLKGALESLITKYDSSHTDRVILKKQYDIRVTWLKKFLATNEINELNSDENISFKDFITFLSKEFEPQEQLLTLFSNDFWKKGKKESVALFTNFRDADANENPFSFYAVFPPIREFTSYLSPTDIKNLSATSFTLFNETKNIDYWRDKLLRTGINAELLKDVIQMNVIHNYKKLYYSFKKLSYAKKLKVNKSWQLLCMCGELGAFQKAIKDGLTKETKDNNKLNALHYAAISGNPKVMKAAVTLGIKYDSVDEDGLNALHYAALSGDPKAMKAAVELGIKYDSISDDWENALHCAALSGNPEAMKAAVELGIDPKSANMYGANVLHYAARSGNPEAMYAAVKLLGIKSNGIFKLLGIKFDNMNDIINRDGKNALHYAAQYGNPKVMDAALKLGINPKSKDKEGANVLHYAARNNPEAIDAAIKLGVKYDSVAYNDINALHYAAGWGTIQTIDRLLELGIKLTSINKFGRNTLHYAASYSDDPDVIYHLRSLGLDPTTTDELGYNAFWFAEKNTKNIKEEIKKALSNALPEQKSEREFKP